MIRKNAPGKNPSPERCPPGNCSLKNYPPPPRKFSTGKLSPMEPFCEFFLISSFCFYENFRPKEKSIFIQSLFILNLFILYVCIIFSLAYIFDFQAWHTMFIIHICVSNNAGHRYLDLGTCFF